MFKRILCIVPALLLLSLVALSQEEDISFKKIGKIKPRKATEIQSSSWSIGAETMDRRYTIYDNWKEYLEPLGFKRARLQGGWARTEQTKGVYDFSWLDSVVFDMPKRGVKPWIGLGYGNAIYSGGGGTTLFGNLPDSPEALQAWDKWVQHMVSRYKGVVNEWEIWNEPNYRIPAKKYADFLIRTAQIIKDTQPESRVLAFALGSGVDYKYADSVLHIVSDKRKIHLIDEVTFHRHQFVPEDYVAVERLREVIDKYDSRISLRQGESGAPTGRRTTKALNNYDWTETSASKWALRRLLGDLGRDIPSNYFSMMDMKYPDEMNIKGILQSREDQTVERPKATYFALQNLASVFDNTIERIPDYSYLAPNDTALSVFAYRKKNTSQQIVTVWLNNGTPVNHNQKLPINFIFDNGQFKEPVYVDLRTGIVYQIPKEKWKVTGKKYVFSGIPVYDSPILIADKSTIVIDASL